MKGGHGERKKLLLFDKGQWFFIMSLFRVIGDPVTNFPLSRVICDWSSAKTHAAIFTQGLSIFHCPSSCMQPVISAFNLLHLRQLAISRTAHLTLCQVHVQRNYYYALCAIHLREKEKFATLAPFISNHGQDAECAPQRSNRALTYCILHSPAPHIAQTARVKRALVWTRYCSI